MTNVKIHENNKYLLKIDLKDFFPSIKINWVMQVFKELGYENYVAFYLASLCCFDGKLPQGAPSSPAISNIVAIHLDRRLYRLAKKFNLNYSRYADDMAFSGDKIDGCFIHYVCDIINNCGFSVNENKIRMYKDRGSKIITGISLATGVPRITRSYRRELEQQLYYIKKFGLKGHINHNKIRKANYLESIIGKINFWLMVEPENSFAKEMYEFVKKIYYN
jgi:RNA-directed DNA polymerase